MKNRKRTQEPKPKTANPIELAAHCITWLNNNGYFAFKIFMDGIMLVLAIKGGQAHAICTNSGTKGPHDPKGIMKRMARGGAKTYCVASMEDLAKTLPV